MKLWPSKYNYYYKLDSKYTFINNILTGALDFIKSKDWDLMLGGKFEEVDSDPLSSLIERGYYYKDPEEEEKLFAELFKNFSAKAKNRPVKYVICPTYSCNLNCTYCFEKDALAGNKMDMDESLLEASLESIKTISKNINKDIVRKILEFAVKKDAKITIVTNGVFAGDFIDILSQAKDNIEMLQITIDGPESIHDKRRMHFSGKGSFAEVSCGIDDLLDNKINTNARINIDMENIEYLPEIYEYMLKMGWIGHPNFKVKPSLITDHTTLEYTQPIVEEEKLLERLISIYDENPELEKLFGFYSFKPLRHIQEILHGAPNVSPRFFNCESNLLELYIFCPDGYIYTCPESIGNKDISIGKFIPSLELSTSGMSEWRDRDIMNIKKCKDCKFAPICGGGCPYSSMIISGGEEPVCERYQEVLDTYLQHRGKKMLESLL